MPEHRLPDLPPFHRMLRRLKANGFLLGVDSYLRVAEFWQVVETNEDDALASDELRAQIKAQLSALLCRSAEQQELFGQAFDTFLPKGITPLENDGENRLEQEQRTDPNSPTSIKTDDKKRPISIPERPLFTPNPSEKMAPVLPLLNFPEEPLRVWNLTKMGPAMTPLQEKVWTDSSEWDVPGTIRAITRAGGFPKLIFKKRKQAPRYLALIEQQSPRDHLAGYAAELIKEINRRDLEAEFYFFDKNPGHCWKEQREQQTHVSIELLRSEWSGARLLLLGHASHFVNPATGTPSNLALELPDDFSNVALLATNANVEWGAAERSLSSLMPVVPMSVEGLGKLMDAWNGAAQPGFEEWQTTLPEQSPPKLMDGYRQPDSSEIFMEVYRYLGNEAFMWLCACAVYPELYFELTCILHDEAIPLAADLSEWQRNERWNQALRLLSRLEWFRKGELPETLAEELKKNLTPADLLLVEGEIKRILAISKNQVSDQSYAAELRNELFDWMASQSFRVLWIDDRPQNNQQYRDSWSKTLGIHFKLATTSSEAHGYLNNEHFDLVISDLGRPGEELTGQITLDIVAKRAPVVFFTNKRGLNLRGTLLSAGAREVTNSVGVLSELVREEMRKKFPLVEQVPEVPDLDLSGLGNVGVQENKPKKEKAAPQKKATKKEQPTANEQVRKDQEMLKELGFYEGRVDGIANDLYKKAVKDFQGSILGFPMDGIVGPQTRAAMEKILKEKQMQKQQTSQPYDATASTMPDFEEKKLLKKQEILDFLSNGDVDKAIKELRVLLPDDNTVLNLTSQYNRLAGEQRRGTISNDYANLTNNQIVNSLIQIARKLPDDMDDEAGNVIADFDDNSTYVYIEHSSVNAPYAQSVAGHLEDNNFKTIIDDRNLIKGQERQTFIQRSMDVCEAAIFLISSESFQSPTLVKSLDYLFGSEFSKKKFFCCALDMRFREKYFLSATLKEIDENIIRLKAANSNRISQNPNTSIGNFVEGEQLSNYMEMRELLPKILNRLSHVQLIDISGNNFERGMHQIVNFLRPPTSKRPVFK